MIIIIYTTSLELSLTREILFKIISLPWTVVLLSVNDIRMVVLSDGFMAGDEEKINIMRLSEIYEHFFNPLNLKYKKKHVENILRWVVY